MIPGTLVRKAIGYCTGNPSWWSMYFDLITRADVHEIGRWRYLARNFALVSGDDLDPRTTIFSFAPPWRMWLVSKYGNENVSDYRYPRPPLCAMGTIEQALTPVVEDFCYAPYLEFPMCNGSCASQ